MLEWGFALALPFWDAGHFLWAIMDLICPNPVWTCFFIAALMVSIMLRYSCSTYCKHTGSPMSAVQLSWDGFCVIDWQKQTQRFCSVWFTAFSGIFRHSFNIGSAQMSKGLNAFWSLASVWSRVIFLGVLSEFINVIEAGFWHGHFGFHLGKMMYWLV